MLDTVGPELQVVNKTENPISLQADTLVVLTPDQNKEATSNLLPVNFSGLSKVSNSIPFPSNTCFRLKFLKDYEKEIRKLKRRQSLHASG